MATREVFFADAGVPTTGLTLTWESLKKVSDGTDFTPQPTFTEIGGGWYKFDIAPDERLVGVIDGGVTLNDTDRYVPVFFDKYDFLFEVLVTPVYDEDADLMTFVIFLTKNGQRQTADLGECTLNVYTSAGVLKFTLSTSTETDGVFVLTKSTPALDDNEIYYAVATVEFESVVYDSTDTFISLE